MKLSEVIAMVEEWLYDHTYNYKIYKIKRKSKGWKIRFYEQDPFGKIECDTYFYVPFDKVCIFNYQGDDMLEFSKDADSDNKDWIKWYDEFEKKWRYGE